CSSPSGSRRSSMKRASPATCFGAESWRSARRTTRSRNSSERRSSGADIRRLPESDEPGLTRRGAADLGQRLAQKRARDVEPVGSTRALVVDRLEIFRQRRNRSAPLGRLVKVFLDQRLL